MSYQRLVVICALVVLIPACGGSDFGDLEEETAATSKAVSQAAAGPEAAVNSPEVNSPVGSHQTALAQSRDGFSPDSWFYCGSPPAWNIPLPYCENYTPYERSQHCAANCGSSHMECEMYFGADCAASSIWYSDGCYGSGPSSDNLCRAHCWAY